MGRPSKEPPKGMPSRIRKTREKLGLTLEEFAERIREISGDEDFGYDAAARWERGDTKEPGVKNCLAAAIVLGVSPVWLVFGKEL